MKFSAALCHCAYAFEPTCVSANYYDSATTGLTMGARESNWKWPIGHQELTANGENVRILVKSNLYSLEQRNDYKHQKHFTIRSTEVLLSSHYLRNRSNL